MTLSRLFILLTRFFQVLHDKSTKLDDLERRDTLEDQVEELRTKE